MARVAEAGLPYRVVEVDGRVLGYAYAAPYRPGQVTGIPSRIRSTLPEGAAPGSWLCALDRLIEQCEALGARQLIAVMVTQSTLRPFDSTRKQDSGRSVFWRQWVEI
ncbi:MAG: hypothetical protein CM1200mP20_10250 [Pseudomonadota bacterium]|nr:MAG: hypothetical protein CM1200mP20_10250 [Pseudomonadota bacterium]